MEVVEACKVFLSNAEVYHILKQQQKDREAVDSLGRPLSSGSSSKPLRASENVHTIEYEVLRELETRKPIALSHLVPLIHALRKDPTGPGLSLQETLQVINLWPRSIIELYVIIEDASSRLTDASIKQILGLLEHYSQL